MAGAPTDVPGRRVAARGRCHPQSRGGCRTTRGLPDDPATPPHPSRPGRLLAGERLAVIGRPPRSCVVGTLGPLVSSGRLGVGLRAGVARIGRQARVALDAALAVVAPPDPVPCTFRVPPPRGTAVLAGPAVVAEGGR